MATAEAPTTDRYTATTRDWLDERFRRTDPHGVYLAHQPIYGFRRGPTERGNGKRYAITTAAMSALAGVEFETLVDVGGAEGYKAALARELFAADVTSCDLSAEACRRAEAIYRIPAVPVDIHALPFGDGAFDVALCSETLEHVPDLAGATKELLRIARKAVVITVPKEPPHVVEENIRRRTPHAHIHALDVHSFDWVRELGWDVRVDRILSPWTVPLLTLCAAEPLRGAAARTLVGRLFNLASPVLRTLFGRRALARAIRLDRAVARRRGYADMVFTLTPSGARAKAGERRDVAPERVIDFAVPLHYVAPTLQS